MAELQPIIVFHGRPFVRHLGICNQICVKLLQVMSGVILSNLKEGLVSELKPIREGMKNLPKAITFPQFPSITAYDDDDCEKSRMYS